MRIEVTEIAKEEHHLTGAAQDAGDESQTVVLGDVLRYGVEGVGEVVLQPFPSGAAGIGNDDLVEPGSLVDNDLREAESDSGKRCVVELQHSAWDREEDDEPDDFPSIPAFTGEGDAKACPGNDDERQSQPESVAGVEDLTAGGIHELARQLIENELEVLGSIDGRGNGGEHGSVGETG